MKHVNLLWIESSQRLYSVFNSFLKNSEAASDVKIDYFKNISESSHEIGYTLILMEIDIHSEQSQEDLKTIMNEYANIPVILISYNIELKYMDDYLKLGAQEIIDIDTISANALLRIIKYTILRFEHNTRDKDFKNLIVNSTDGILILDKNNTILFVNNTAEQILEKKAYNLIQQEFGYPVGLTDPIEFNLIFEENREKKVEIRSQKIMWSNHDAYLLILHDLTKIKKQQQNLEVYKRIINSSTQGIAVIRLNHQIKYVNYALLNMIGEYDYKNIIKKDLTELFYASESLIDQILKRLYKNQTWTGEMTLSTSNGKKLPLICSFFMIKDNASNPLYVTMMLTDITEQKQKEMEIKESENKLFKILNTIPVGLLLLDESGKIYFSNDKSENILGKDKFDWKGYMNGEVHLPLYITDTDIEYAQSENPFIQSLNGNKCYVDNIEVDNDGERIPVEVWGAPVENENGEVLYGSAVFADISDRKEKEKTIKNLLKCINQSSSIIVITDIDGKIEFVNKAFNLVTQYSAGESIGKYVNILKCDNYNDSFYENMWELVRAGKTWRGEFMNKKKDGTVYYEQATISPIFNKKMEIVNFIKVSEDITNKKADELEKEKLEMQLIESEKLSAVGELAAGVAHEFNNILAVIKSSVELLLLQKRLGHTDIPENVLKEITSIDGYATKASDIANNLMAMSKPMESKKESYSIEEIIDSIVKVQSKQARLENITITKEYNNKANVFIDKGQINQVLLNLLINARHAIKEKGGEGEIYIHTFEREEDVEITVRDTGVGIPDKVKNKIFNPFFTTKGANSKNNLNINGTGLGLSVTHKIISNHHGSIKFESVEGEYTKFIIELPKVQGNQDEQGNENDTHDLEVDISDKKIIVLDDEKDITTYFKDILFALGATRVSIVNDSNTFAVELKKEKTDLAFIDLMMPGMTGEELYKRIRAKSKDLKIVLMSGNIDKLSDYFHVEDKRLYTLNKPFSIDEVIEILNHLKEK